MINLINKWVKNKKKLILNNFKIYREKMCQIIQSEFETMQSQ